MRGGLVAMDHGREDVLRPVALLQPVQGAAEIAVLVLPAHGMDLFGRSADEVFQRMNGVLADLLGGAGDPGLDDPLAGAGAFQDQVVALAVQIGVRGVAFTEVVAEGCAQMALGLDLGDAQDGKALRRPRPLPHLLVLAELCHHIRHVAPPI